METIEMYSNIGSGSEDEDCNLSDNEEEKSHVQSSTQKKAFLSIDRILE